MGDLADACRSVKAPSPERSGPEKWSLEGSLWELASQDCPGRDLTWTKISERRVEDHPGPGGRFWRPSALSDSCTAAPTTKQDASSTFASANNPPSVIACREASR